VRIEREKHGERNAREFWWRYQRSRPELYEAISNLERVVVLAQTSSTVMPVLVTTKQVFSTKIVVFDSGDTALLALLSSAPHLVWTLDRASTLKTDVSYTPSDVFQTLPMCGLTEEMRELGMRLENLRSDAMLSRRAGLTKLYSLVRDQTCSDVDIVRLRRIHEEIDRATVAAYGWDDLLDKLDHGFHPTGRDLRHTIGPWAQREILDRLLELNHERYADEVKRGLHDKRKARATAASKKKPADAEVLF
jgi:hypothetical protein